ncbi:discoidin domain-containing receptor 2-like [Tribolium madens]|uniref:discoidin domain-containing receptor 2-like n=1 Tax=Tribolium madens TaxID=41895 RepID=UPI001CF73255|nr:discoidin domain-containing receptor 2-like [Tribolium madens]XP_044269645.1 discoidin domain-containing receptor 2-like [Tribolium madens]
MWISNEFGFLFLTALTLSYLNLYEAFETRSCNEPLGMESGTIPDEAITASSSYVPNVGPRNGRVRVEKAGGGWCPKQQVERGIREYLQVDLGEVHVVTGVQTQGRYDRGRGQEYAEEYTVEYWRPGLNEWKEYKRWDNKQILRGNSDTASVESQRLMPPVFASKVRILPYSVHRRTVCLRIELLGCPYEGGIISYSIPEGSEPSQGLYDSSYDGTRNDGILEGGLGRLVDGEFGADNFRLDIGYGKGNGWIAWRNDTSVNGYVELTFEFDQIRNFSEVHLFTNNFFSRNVQVFSKAKVMFSIGGRFYNGPTLSYSYMPDRVLENARNVSINLHQRLARFIKLRLFFADRWMMLSEVAFDSVPVAFNISEEETLDLSENELVISSAGGNTLDAFETIAARKEGDTYVEIIIGVLTAIILLLLVVFVIILILNKRHKLQGSPTLLKNPFGVTINMKDLLMNLSSSNNAAQSSHPTPVSQEAPGDSSSVSFEQYRSPLVGNYYTPNYATLRCSSTMEEPEEPPEVPPLPDSPTLHQSPISASSPLHYRSLQSTPAISPKSKMINLGNYFPRVATDPPNRKRYHTAPREKHRIPPPVVCWNIAPSMGHAYSCREAELVPIPRYSLRPLEKVGSCHAGEITLCETEGLEDIIPGVCRLVAVRTPSPERAKSDAATGSMESLREVRFLASLSDTNICKVLGVCTAEQPPWTVIEYGEMGDLAQYLQFLVNRNGTVRSSTDQPVSVDNLIYMASQIASGMKYLESKHVVHKDLAARNCLVGRRFVVKIADVAMCKPQYKKDYAEIGGRPPAPIRWLPWESILLDRYSCSSSVWAFAVTLWEILTFACERPFSNLSNEKVIQNAEHMYYGGELQVLLSKPPICSTEIYEVMCQCWKRDDTERPTFKEICLFLKHHNKDYTPND